MRPDLRLPRLLPEMAKREAPSDPELLVPLASVKLETLLVIQRLPQENPQAEVIQSVSELVMRLAPAMRQPSPVIPQENSKTEAILRLAANWRSPLLVKAKPLEAAKRRPLPEMGLPRAEARLARARLQNLRLRGAVQAHFPLLWALARRHSLGPGPCASSPKTLVVRKCSRAARCDGRPICARYRLRSNRRVPAGCDNSCSRSQRKHARRGRTFPIAALDRYRCLPRQIAD